jgi:hypothetical protein
MLTIVAPMIMEGTRKTSAAQTAESTNQSLPLTTMISPKAKSIKYKASFIKKILRH